MGISRGELEKELNQIREQIMNLQSKWKQQELEKMSYFQLIKAFLLFFNIYLSLLTSYQTFATKYNELEIGIAEPNTIQLIAILFRALPYIFTKKTCFRAMRRSIVFIFAFIFLSRESEKYRNIGFLISTSYSAFCAYNVKTYQLFYHYLLNIFANIVHLSNRYVILHGMMDYFKMGAL